MIKLSRRPSAGAPLPVRLRAVVSGALSVLVLAFGAAYVVAPEGPRLAITSAEAAGTPVFDYDATVDYRLVAARTRAVRASETIYGEINLRARVDRAWLTIDGVGKRVRDQHAQVMLRGSGAYRAEIHVRPGRYRVVASVVSGRTTYAAPTRLTLRNGHSYRITLGQLKQGIVSHLVTMLPVSSY